VRGATSDRGLIAVGKKEVRRLSDGNNSVTGDSQLSQKTGRMSKYIMPDERKKNSSSRERKQYDCRKGGAADIETGESDVLPENMKGKTSPSREGNWGSDGEERICSIRTKNES